ncbi:unnamed protein product [Clonostachys rosea f. rosea IK726]|uniref:Uncharacterized protein n=1 Tax=Clonostachys rosea f. rosea IK726 TaxID=1349383 RepID=A0ACA9T8A8_BIOOC|nr:unnamed protein product [Clonostachys rosea f. rosea IK726]
MKSLRPSGLHAYLGSRAPLIGFLAGTGRWSQGLIQAEEGCIRKHGPPQRAIGPFGRVNGVKVPMLRIDVVGCEQKEKAGMLPAQIQ